MNPIVENLLAKADLLILSLIWAALLWMALRNQYLLAKTLAEKVTGVPPATIPPVVHVLQAPAPALPVSPPPPPPLPPVTPAVDQGLVDFIKTEEGFKATPYWDYKQWTVGYGTKASGPQDVITEAEAERRLIAEISAADKTVNDFMPNLPKGQRQALVDLTFNAGPGWEQGSLGAAVKAQKLDTIKADILLYNHAGGQVSPGLTARRETEIKWFDNPL